MGPDEPLLRGFLDGDCRDEPFDSDGRREILREPEGGKVERIGLQLGSAGPDHRQAVQMAVGGRLAVCLDVLAGLDVGPVWLEWEAFLARDRVEGCPTW